MGYTKNSSFTIPVDSYATQARANGNNFTAYIDNKLNFDLDYKIVLFGSGQAFTLTGFEIEKKGCNECFPYRPESDYYKVLSGYEVNGQKQRGRQIDIYK